MVPTFEGSDLPGLCFGQAFLTGIGGQCQRHATAAQEEADLLTSCILREPKGKRKGWIFSCIPVELKIFICI